MTFAWNRINEGKRNLRLLDGVREREIQIRGGKDRTTHRQCSESDVAGASRKDQPE